MADLRKLQCPSCGAPLADLPPEGRFECAYCGTSFAIESDKKPTLAKKRAEALAKKWRAGSLVEALARRRKTAPRFYALSLLTLGFLALFDYGLIRTVFFREVAEAACVIGLMGVVFAFVALALTGASYSWAREEVERFEREKDGFTIGAPREQSRRFAGGWLLQTAFVLSLLFCIGSLVQGIVWDSEGAQPGNALIAISVNAIIWIGLCAVGTVIAFFAAAKNIERRKTTAGKGPAHDKPGRIAFWLTPAIGSTVGLIASLYYDATRVWVVFTAVVAALSALFALRAATRKRVLVATVDEAASQASVAGGAP